MITRIWSGASSLYLLLLPFSWLYGFVTTLIRLSYRRGWRKVHRFRLPIVVIGNLSVGGTGKTPLVVWLVTKLQQRGWKVGVVSRGYGGWTAHYPLVLNDATTSGQCGDEPLLIHQRTGVPVAVAPRRAEAVAALLCTQELDVVVTDDGLQHYALGRDIEWVVIDGERRFGNGWWLPAGPMRERAVRLKTAQSIIVNGGDSRPGEVRMQLHTGAVINVLNGAQRALTSLTSVVAMASIAHPPRFFATIRTGGVTPLREISFSDHQSYRQKMLDTLVKPYEQLLMTEKDAVKCRAFARDNWWYLPVEAQLPANAETTLLVPIEQAICYYRQARVGDTTS